MSWNIKSLFQKSPADVPQKSLKEEKVEFEDNLITKDSLKLREYAKNIVEKGEWPLYSSWQIHKVLDLFSHIINFIVEMNRSQK